MPTVAQGRRRQSQTPTDRARAVVSEQPAPDVVKSRGTTYFWMSWGLLFAAQLPLVAIHLRNLWTQPRYQFFPLFVVLLGGLVWSRWKDVRQSLHPTAPPSAWSWWQMFETPLLLGSLTTLAGGVIVDSPWLGMVSCLLALTSLALTIQQHLPNSGVVAAVSALWILVPPPFNLDLRLVQFLQRKTALLSSRILDLLGFNHLLEGTVIQFPNRQVLVEEACSGVQSFFALVAVSILFGLWRQRRMWQIVVLIIASGCCSLAGNTLRILVITLIDPRVHSRIDLTTGWGHELLGLTAFAFSFGLLVSFDHFLQFLSGPIEDIDSEPTPMSQVWNRWLSRRMPSISANLDTQDLDQFRPTQHAIQNIVRRRVPWWCIGLFLALTVLQMASLTRGHLIEASQPSQSVNMGKLTARSLPPKLGDWQFQQFDVEQRDDGRTEGGISRIWRYRHPAYDATVSLDYPFIDSHNLTTCYVHRGWIVTERKIYQRRSGIDALPYVEVQFRRPTGEAGFLLFALFDKHGQPVPPPATVTEYWQRLQNRIAGTRLAGLFNRSSNAVSGTSGEIFQLQIFISTHVDLTQKQRQVLHQHFHGIYQTLIDARQRQESAQ